MLPRMGAWGVGSLENDGAGDLLASIRHGDFTYDDFAWAFADSEYVEVDSGQAAIAMLTLLLAIRGIAPLPEIEPVPLDGVASELTAERIEAICTMVERTTADAETSELYDLWAESGDVAAWRDAVVRDLARLRASL
jgi:hypothetical protein